MSPAPGGMNSSLFGSLTFPLPGIPPLLGPGTGPGPTGSNLAPGGAPNGGRYPSPPHGPRPPNRSRISRLGPKIGWSGPTNIPSPDPGGKRDGGANGFCGNGSRSRRPISRGLSGSTGCEPKGMSGPAGGATGCGRAGGGLREDDGAPPEAVDTPISSVYPSFRKPGIMFCTMANLYWDTRSATRLEDMYPCTRGGADVSIL